VSEGLESNEVSEGVSALSAIKKKERKRNLVRRYVRRQGRGGIMIDASDEAAL